MFHLSFRLTIVLLTMVALGAGVSTIHGAAPTKEPRVFVLDAKTIVRNKARIGKGDTAMDAAAARIMSEGERALKTPLQSVIEKTLAPPSGDKHDYMSVGKYWWPDPSKPDGLPYINRDGEVNPATRNGGITDAPRMGKTIWAVRELAYAYFLSGEEKYAERAAAFLKTWFLDPETRMNPNLNFAQAIPGRVKGRGTGIIDTATLVEIVDAVGLLEGSPVWTDADTKGMEEWFGAYLDWLLTSKNGRNEAHHKNNHGTYYDTQVACYALFVGKPEIARKVLEEAKEQRIASQVEPDGSQPHELRRTRSFGYSIMNLNGLMRLARLGEHVGVDLWNYRTDDGRSIRAALDYVAPYADPAKEKDWGHKLLGGMKRDALLTPLWRGALVYKDPKYRRLITLLPANRKYESQCHLRYAPLDTP